MNTLTVNNGWTSGPNSQIVAVPMDGAGIPFAGPNVPGWAVRKAARKLVVSGDTRPEMLAAADCVRIVPGIIVSRDMLTCFDDEM